MSGVRQFRAVPLGHGEEAERRLNAEALGARIRSPALDSGPTVASMSRLTIDETLDAPLILMAETLVAGTL